MYEGIKVCVCVCVCVSCEWYVLCGYQLSCIDQSSHSLKCKGKPPLIALNPCRSTVRQASVSFVFVVVYKSLSFHLSLLLLCREMNPQKGKKGTRASVCSDQQAETRLCVWCDVLKVLQGAGGHSQWDNLQNRCDVLMWEHKSVFCNCVTPVRCCAGDLGATSGFFWHITYIQQHIYNLTAQPVVLLLLYPTYIVCSLVYWFFYRCFW